MVRMFELPSLGTGKMVLASKPAPYDSKPASEVKEPDGVGWLGFICCNSDFLQPAPAIKPMANKYIDIFFILIFF